ncbi:MAG: (2Fe-2S)-binding protein [Enterobacteriaceae bacterium]
MTMSLTLVTLTLDGLEVKVPAGISVAALLQMHGDGYCRHTFNHERRGPLCGMGICQECRITVDGKRRLACQTLCLQGMCIERISHE